MPGSIQPLSRAAAVLRLFATGEGRFGLSDTACALGLPKGTVHGILRTLQQEGLVEQDTDSRTYGLGPELVRLGGDWLRTHDLRARTLAWADDLARNTGGAVHVGVPHPLGVLIIHHVFRRGTTRQILDTGRVVPIEETALGTVLAAHCSEVIDAFGPAPDLLHVTRRQGWICVPDRPRDGVLSIAAPVRDRQRATVAALSVTTSAAHARDNAAARDHLVSSVRMCARAISQDLGANHP